MKAIRMICVALCVALVEVPFALNVHAGMISTGDAVSEMLRSQNRVKVATFMKRSDVQEQFTKFGVNPTEASLRVATMTDSELQQVALQIDSAPAGAEVIVIGLSTVLIIILILLLLHKI